MLTTYQTFFKVGSNEKTYLRTNLVQIKDGPSSGSFYRIELKKALSPKESVTVEVETVLAKALEMFPKELVQRERQLVLFKGNHYVFLPYKSKSQTTKVTLSGTGAIKVFKAGHKALSEIKGLRGLVFRALLLNYLIFSAATFLLNGLFYYFLLNPIIKWLFGGGEGFWASLGTFILWSIQLTVSAAFALAALRFSVSLVALWNQSLVERVIYHFRKIERRTFSFNIWLAEVKYIFREALKSCIYPVLLLSVGLIPVIGLLLVFILESHLLGRESIIAYSDCLKDFEESKALRKKWRLLPVRIGWLPAILTFIPFLGWLLLPLSITYEVVGFAFLAEQSRNS